jgi:hypothetical protein
LFGDEGNRPSVIKVDIPQKEMGEIKMERKCKTCGKDISNRNKRSEWCVECYVERKRKQNREGQKLRYQQMKGQSYHKVKEEISMKDTPKEYTLILIDGKGIARTFKAKEQ